MTDTTHALTPQELIEGSEEAETSSPSESASTARFLTFVSGGLTFGVPTDQVIEIITNHNIRSLPLVPDYVRGIINLRGQILPIIDVRLRLGKPFQEYTSSTCIIILDIGADRIGIGVDSVSQVLTVDTAAASPIPLENRQKLATSMIATEEGKVVLLLDCNALTEP
ncbi:chemotaxis protein CheW [Mediterraneibacter sp. NSJ-55]|uniref:Chemotaxis protein CheW n=1 Tax=Mediterraneibacter hominis TaxID=2763054 RepID=A0A923RQB7_9FIRM|nr:chemotaxis protein CheW [Mediterraneibacter hominis]MBC5689326.1 chemotaxis protein CheW [Mediterraneibacter hominis]